MIVYPSQGAIPLVTQPDKISPREGKTIGEAVDYGELPVAPSSFPINQKPRSLLLKGVSQEQNRVLLTVIFSARQGGEAP